MGNGIPKAPGSIQAQTPHSTPQLLPHEQAARDRMLEANKKAEEERLKAEADASIRQFEIHAGPGPQFTRGGRPRIWDPEERDRLTQQASRKREAMEWTRKNTAQRPKEVIRHIMGEGMDNPRSILRATESTNSPETSQWTHLKKRGEPGAAASTPPSRDRFTEGRVQRENVAEIGIYRPLTSRPSSLRPGQVKHSEQRNPQYSDQGRIIPYKAEEGSLEASSIQSQRPLEPKISAPSTINSSRLSQMQSTQKHPHGSIYSIQQWQKDAAYLSVIKEEMENGHFGYLQSLVTQGDIREANLILRGMDPRIRDENKAWARNNLQFQPPVEAGFSTFIERFKAGPSDEDQNELAHPSFSQKPLFQSGRGGFTPSSSIPARNPLGPSTTQPRPPPRQEVQSTWGPPISRSRGQQEPQSGLRMPYYGTGGRTSASSRSILFKEADNYKPSYQEESSGSSRRRDASRQAWSEDPFAMPDRIRASVSTAGSLDPVVSWRASVSTRQPEPQGRVQRRNDNFSQGSSRLEPRNEEPPRRIQPAEEQEENTSKPRKLSKRFTDSEPTYDDLPKGKARDKVRRRQQYYNDPDEEDARESAAARTEAKKQRKKEKAAAKAAAPTPILLPEYISVSNLAVALKVKVEEFVGKLEELGFEEVGHDHILNAENAGLIAMEYNYEPIIDRGQSGDLRPRGPAEDPSSLPQRPPVVTIMGHVDHGKTTILDYLRKSSVAATEHGGITQHIGAFSVPMPSGKIITFLDTPGHAAFLSMRQRGANVTDIVILVVAADDSVKPQTIEAINHAKAAKVPIIVAINKIDKEETNIDRVKQDLARHGVDIEDFGGDTQVVCVSGKTGQGMPELEEAAVTLSEILDMRAEIDGQAEGWVIEASIKSMGKVATVLVRRGTMRPGDFIVAGKTWARIRCLRNEAGIEIDEAGPGTPVEIDGWREQPVAGDEVLQASDEAKAKSVVEYRLDKEVRDKLAEDMEAINENRKVEQERREREKADKAAALVAAGGKDGNATTGTAAGAAKVEGGPKPVYFIVKGDVSGSVEAVLDSISSLSTREVTPHILRSGVGQLSEFDIEHAASAKGHCINFNTSIESKVARLAEESKVSILDHNIIYRLVDDVRAELSKHLPPLVTQRVVGEAEIAQAFEINVKGRQYKSVAGCKVRNGTVGRLSRVRVLRGGEKVFDGLFPLFANSLFSFANIFPIYSTLEWRGEFINGRN